MKRNIYIYQKDINDEIMHIFNAVNENIKTMKSSNDLITVLDEDFYNEDPVDLIGFQELIYDDFGREITIVIEPYTENGFELSNDISSFIPNLPYGVYFFEEVISYVVLKNDQALKSKIKDYILSKVSNDVLHTVLEFIDNNMNSSLSAKKLFMHRNTLNYRIDNFIEATNINVKAFKGANAIYMLFKL